MIQGFCTDCGNWTALREGRCGCGSGRVAVPPAGYTILGPDEIHAPSVERALPALKAAAYKLIADEHDLHLADAVEVNGWQWPDDGPKYIHGTIHQVLAALRELMKEKGRG